MLNTIAFILATLAYRHFLSSFPLPSLFLPSSFPSVYSVPIPQFLILAIAAQAGYKGITRRSHDGLSKPVRRCWH
jgi:hypothetical protein